MRFTVLLPFLYLAVAGSGAASAQPPDIELFFQATSLDKEQGEAALEKIAQNWNDGYAGLIIDLARFYPSSRRRPSFSAPGGVEEFGIDRTEDPGRLEQPFGELPDPVGRPSAPISISPEALVRARLIRFLEKQTDKSYGDDLSRWRKWIWNQPFELHPDYPLFKAALYGRIDRRMAEFFPPGGKALIRLDEVDWGGVGVNGIPPLDHPKHISMPEADYLDDDDIIFGIALHGEARAYPKRILAWHELARDAIGGVELTIVYCTLCGTVIPYGAEVGGKHRTLGTSGLLYRSNKLMFDEETMSLWSTVEGRPVLGPLAGEDLELQIFPVVTTTWKEWRTLHPETIVLSRDTGFDRDYSEGAAYRDYFRTDKLMFGVPETDKRLKNKAEVLAILLRPKGSSADSERRPLALSAKFLEKNRVHHMNFAGHDLVVITSKEGANRVYDAAGHRFVKLLKDGKLRDSDGRLWTLTEDALVSDETSSSLLPRVPARRAFWFGWYAQFPDTALVK